MRTTIKKIKYFLALLLIGNSVLGQNPITNALGVSDPHVRVFNDTIYLFSGHDASPQDKLWVMKDWRVFASTNLLDWKQVQTISPKDNYMDDNSVDCWASDAATRNGKYYFYFSDKKRGIGVMTAQNPKGPYKDALGKALVSPMHDPTIFIDDNKAKTPYIIYGDKSDAYYISPLNDDMISVTEAPKPIVIHGEAWEKAPKWMDKNYLFKYKDTYYLSWGRDYATSKNIYGPYNCVGSFGNKYNLNELAHGSFFWWKGQFYHVWCYYIKNGFRFRETIMSYCHISDNGEIVTDTNFLDKHFANGVGQYNASWDKFEAEWYSEVSAEIVKKGSKNEGFALSNIKNGSFVKFANVNFESLFTKMEIALNQTKGKGTIEIREESLKGPILGTVLVNENNSSVKQLVSGAFSNTIGKKDIYLKFVGDFKFTTQLDSFSFLK